jgi:hypothetical protein
LPIRYFYVIVKRWDPKDDKNTFFEIPEGELKNFNNSTNGKKAYIAIINNGYQSNMAIIVGDNSSFPARRSALEYRNAPLSEDTQYAIFIRVFYNYDGVSYSV